MNNKAILIGNVGKEPELREVGSTKCCAFSLATNKSYKDKDGNWQNQTQWHNIVAWRATAEYIYNNIKKGNLLYVEGEITYRTWEDQNGNPRNTTEIIADKVIQLERKPSSNNNSEEDDYPA